MLKRFASQEELEKERARIIQVREYKTLEEEIARIIQIKLYKILE